MDDLATKFQKFCIQGRASQGDLKTVNNKNLTKLMKDCKIVGKSLTTTDIDITFSKIMGSKKEMSLAQFKEFLKVLAPKYKKDHKLADDDAAFDAMIEKVKGGGVSTAGTTGTSKTGGVGKMTDASQYTGAHKERFDASGKGKGIEGREDRASGDGYVGAYKGKDTFDKK
ncbi:unnamed protein product [Owenia fusiformis]|uniref:Uncharacterized protein n=1 Tax=Owenia fusiformis TaxID=6347 RepID=A0A8J1YAD5_OWEFU|nr:unnamed protein product [Owenia fusiformis]